MLVTPTKSRSYETSQMFWLTDSGSQYLLVQCRSLVNDSYRTDLILMYPPFMIALACIYIASVLKEKDTRSWFEELRVDMNVVWPNSLLNINHVNINLNNLWLSFSGQFCMYVSSRPKRFPS